MKLSVLKRNQLIQKIDLSQEVLTFDYSETVFLIGRSKECHICLDDKQISREHSKFIHRNGKWFIEIISEDSQDLLFNGESVKRAEVGVNDVISIGAFSINIENLSETSNEVEIPKVDIVKVIPEKAPEPIIISTPKQAQVDLNATREINISELAAENEASSAINDNSTREIDIEPASEETNLDTQSETAEEDDFNFDEEPNETFGDSDVINIESSGELTDQGTEANQSYSLESIDANDLDSDNDSTKVIQSFSAVHLELFGETAPYDKFILEKEKTIIGRDPSKCQIILNDSEVSSTHAVITKNNITVTLEDLKSGNGTLLNGERVNKSILGHNDEFVIGGVTFTVKFRSEFLAEEHNRLMPVDENQTVEVEEVIEVAAEEGESLNAFGEVELEAPPEKSIIKRILKDDQLRKKVIYGIVVLVVAWVMFDEDKPVEPPKAVAAKVKNISNDSKEVIVAGKKVNLTQEQRRKFTEYYQFGRSHFDNGRYREALEEFDKINSVDPYFSSALPSMVAAAKEGLRRLEEQEKKRREEEALAERKIKIKKLLEEARRYTHEHNSELANETFQKITTLDPESFEVGTLKRELKSWEDEKKRKELEETQKKSEREARIKKLSPGKGMYLQKNWFHAIAKLEEFLKLSPMDEDLIKEASEMLKTAKEEINAAVNPLLGKAKSLQEGQDLKGAYEVYQQILKYEPSNAESLLQTNEIKETLTVKARKVYREAIISESLSLFQDAKEKFQEVQQISTVDSEYYKKATDKLKDYMD